MVGEPPSLQRFLSSLGERLRALSADELRAALTVYAAGLPGEQRASFLDSFTPSLGQGNDPGRPDTQWPVDDDPLLADIDEFAAAVAAGTYFQGFGWDDEIRDQRAFGDESWVFEMDALFDQAQDAFLAGQLGLARAAYARLLQAFRLDEEVGTFCGPTSAVEMVDTDVDEAQARYLRAVYETTPAVDRADVLAEEWFTVPNWHLPTLASVRESRPGDLPGLETFLPAWIERLRAGGAERVDVRRLLAEAAQAHGGVDGLAELARDSGPGQAERYLDWIEALRSAGRAMDAVAAAREALERLDQHGETSDRIADNLAELLSAEGAGGGFDARRAAWRAAPTQQRLVALHLAATATDQLRRTLSEVCDALDAAESPRGMSGRLRACLLLLAGRADNAIELLEESGDMDGRQSARRVLVPYLLAAGCDGPKRPEWPATRAARLVGSIDHPEAWDWIATDIHGSARPAADASISVAGLFAEQLAAAPDDAARRLHCLDIGMGMVDRYVDAVVSGKHRNRYAEAARLIACCAEVVAMEEDAHSATVVIRLKRDRCSRFVAFKRELDQAVHQSALLTRVLKTCVG